MKKIYSLLLTLFAAGSLSAQQLPNPGFEDGWAATKPYIGGASSTDVGQSPANWTIAHVAGFKAPLLGWMGKTTVGENVAGYNGSESAVKLVNSPNSVAPSQTVPGYITLGTPFNTANTSGNEKDGGTFGGISFGFRPDAISFYYQRELADESNEQATVVAYLWKGSVSQANVRVSIGSNPTKVTMPNRDRNILGMETPYGDEPVKSDDYKRIASINYAIIGSKGEWDNLVIPFEYTDGSTPTMINVIFGSGNYFSTSPEVNNSLTIDDVKLLYYSRLASLSVNGTPVEGFNSDKYTYTIDSEMPEESAFAFSCLGNSGSGKATLSLDKENAVATITVTNSNAGGTDADGETSHSYTIQFNKSTAPENPSEEPDGNKYEGTLTIKLEAMGIDVSQEDKVYIKDNGDGTCTFTLPQFTLTLPGTDPANFGDIVVNNVTVTRNADGTISYSGSVKGMSLAGGEVIADVEITGTETADGKLEMSIPVTWEGLTIDVAFNGTKVVVEEPIYEGKKYDGELSIKLEALGIDVTQDDRIYIKDNGDGTCTFTLPQFTLTLPGTDPANFGDIVVNNVTMTRNADGTISYTGSVKGLSLANGEVIADVEITGTETADGSIVMNIPVTWEGLTIDVTFNGKTSTAGITGITTDNSNAPVEYYNINGMRVNGDNLTPGIYIRRQGTDIQKILVK